ncbi:hypothetical protein ABZW11_18370 [Nonomuraea sp. NPDC004580]|uniref:hypothetical protein n=1 Tax=Nonomuraea sp. NPDC004580 TaxID=3154552 RepID=UPI0033A6237E
MSNSDLHRRPIRESISKQVGPDLHPRLDGLAALVSATFVLLLAASLLTGDPRILLAKESILAGAAGLLLLSNTEYLGRTARACAESP